MAGSLVTSGTTILCSCGASPQSLIVTRPTITATMAAANILDAVPYTNVPSFGVCTITTVTCVPVTVSWTPGSTACTIEGSPALDSSSMLNCCVGGVITITAPGQTKVTVT